MTYQVVGAFWYLLSINREDRCWRDAIGSGDKSALYCDKNGTTINNTLVSSLNNSCPLINPDDIKNQEVFNFGIFFDALESGVVENWDFPKKYFYCFWWGLRNLRFVNNNPLV